MVLSHVSFFGHVHFADFVGLVVLTVAIWLVHRAAKGKV